MDIFSHGLWAGAAYKAINKKVKKPFNIKMAVFWGVFPDLFAFTVGFMWLFANLIFGDLSFSGLPRPQEAEPAPQDTLPIFRLTSTLYNISHSAIIFLIVFGILFLIFRRPIWELGGWLIHIFLDIPTHSYRFFPTPVLWPLSGWKFDGLSWATPWFLIVNYAAIIIVYSFLYGKNSKKPKVTKASSV
jgi:hypothetical protein